MKLHGNVIEARYTKTVAFKRNDDTIEFTLQSFQDDGELEKVHPRPEPGILTIPGQGSIPDTQSKNYLDKVDKWATEQVHYMALKTFQDVEWDTVNFDDPSTWGNWEKDMRGAGFSTGEILAMQSKIFEVNGLSEDAVTDAVKNSSPGDLQEEEVVPS